MSANQNRRDFLKHSIAARLAAALPNVLFMRSAAAQTATTLEGSDLTSSMIWVN
jgi:hypothetical protein